MISSLLLETHTAVTIISRQENTVTKCVHTMEPLVTEPMDPGTQFASHKLCLCDFMEAVVYPLEIPALNKFLFSATICFFLRKREFDYEYETKTIIESKSP